VPLAPLVAALPPFLAAALLPQCASFQNLHGALGGNTASNTSTPTKPAASSLPRNQSTTSFGSSTADDSDNLDDSNDLLMGMEGVDGMEAPPWPTDRWVRAHAAKAVQQRCV